MIFLSSDDTLQVADWPSAVECIRAAYRAPADPGATPGRLIATSSNGSMRCMPAIPPDGQFLGTKQLVKTRSGRVTFVITLFDRGTGELAFIVDALAVTAMRTAATTAAALERLGGPGEADLAVLGSGLEASMHVQAMAAVRPVRSLTVFSPTREKRDAFAARFKRELDIPTSSCRSAEEAVGAASHVIAAARSRDESPILYGDWLGSNAVVASIGSTLPAQRELDVSVIEQSALIVADEPNELADQTGDMLAARDAGIAFAGKLFSLHALVQGHLDERIKTANALVLFKSLGSGLQDIALAEHLATRCIEAGLGEELPIALTIK